MKNIEATRQDDPNGSTPNEAKIERDFNSISLNIRAEAVGVAFRYLSICGVIANMQEAGAMEGAGEFSRKFSDGLLHAISEAAGLSTSAVYAAMEWFNLHIGVFAGREAYKEREVREIARKLWSQNKGARTH